MPLIEYSSDHPGMLRDNLTGTFVDKLRCRAFEVSVAFEHHAARTCSDSVTRALHGWYLSVLRPVDYETLRSIVTLSSAGVVIASASVSRLLRGPMDLPQPELALVHTLTEARFDAVDAAEQLGRLELDIAKVGLRLHLFGLRTISATEG